MRHNLVLVSACAAMLMAASPAVAGGGAPDETASLRDRVDELQQELDSLTEDVEDLQEPVEEFELFEECMYLIGVTQQGSRDGSVGYRFERRAPLVRPALALDIRGFGRATYQFLAFPAEEPPSIECNEDAGEEDVDD